MPRLLAALFFIIVANIAYTEITPRDGRSVTPIAKPSDTLIDAMNTLNRPTPATISA